MSRAMQRCERGVVMLEMLLALIPTLLMFLAVTQVSLLSVAHLVVQHAAQRGARAAIVVLEDDPERYGGLARGSLEASEPAQSTGPSDTLTIVNQYRGSLERVARTLIDRDDSRLNAIRAAVYLPLTVVAPALWQIDEKGSSVADAIDHHALSRLAGGIVYNLIASAVTFPTGPGSTALRTHDFGPNEEVTVRVTHLFKCDIPVASAVMCSKYYELASGQAIDDYARSISAGDRGNIRGAVEHLQRGRQRDEQLEGQSQAMTELEHAELSDFQRLFALSGGRFTTIRAEATLSIQGATYYPRHP